MHRVRKWVNKPAQSESRPACVLDGLALMGQWSLINYLHMYDYKNVRMKLPDKISITPFQQYLAKTFPEDGKHSTSSAVHKLHLTVNAC